MRKITYTLLAPIGEDTCKRKGTLVDLVLSIPYLISGCSQGGFIPPFQVLNDVLMNGDGDAGMSGGCKWKPFTIEEDEYKEMVKALRKKDHNFRLLFAPEWVQSHDDWLNWKLELFLGIPNKKLRAITRKIRLAKAALQDAILAGNEKNISKYRLKVIQVEDEKIALTNSYMLWKQGYA
jgi:hypothetical protein